MKKRLTIISWTFAVAAIGLISMSLYSSINALTARGFGFICIGITLILQATTSYLDNKSKSNFAIIVIGSALVFAFTIYVMYRTFNLQ